MSGPIQKCLVCPVNSITPQIWKNRKKHFPKSYDCAYDLLTAKNLEYLEYFDILPKSIPYVSTYLFLWIGNPKRKKINIPIQENYDIVDEDLMHEYIGRFYVVD